MSQTRSYNLTATATAKLTLTEEDVKQVIIDCNKQVNQAIKLGDTDPDMAKGLKVLYEILAPHKELTEENFDECFHRIIRKGLRDEFASSGQLELTGEGITGRQLKITMIPRGKPKFDTTEITKAAWPFPTSK